MHFSINEQNGQITVLNSSLIDYEKIKQFVVTVKATEVYFNNNVMKKRSGSIIIIVKVDNTNDNLPVLNKKLYELTMDENMAVPYTIDQLIHVSDEDLKFNGNDKLPVNQISALNVQLNGDDADKFRLEKVDEISTVYSSFYRVVAMKSFDAEKKSTYNLEISAFDGETSVVSDIEIKINDLNDNEPLFPESTVEVNIDENLPSDSLVLTIKATDLDLTEKMNQINYRIINVAADRDGFNINNIFKLDSETGELRVNKDDLLDRELFEFFNLTISAYNTENHGSSSNVNVIVRLDDVNDNTPEFEQSSYLINLREKSHFPRGLMKLNAEDNDQGSNSLITYTIRTINGITYENEKIFKIKGK